MRRLIFPAIVLALAAYFAVFGGEYDLFDARRLERQRRADAERISTLRDSLTLLRARVDSLQNDPATLERVAREQYGLIKPGERLYRFAPGDSTPRDSTTVPQPEQ